MNIVIVLGNSNIVIVLGNSNIVIVLGNINIVLVLGNSNILVLQQKPFMLLMTIVTALIRRMLLIADCCY